MVTLATICVWAFMGSLRFRPLIGHAALLTESTVRSCQQRAARCLSLALKPPVAMAGLVPAISIRVAQCVLCRDRRDLRALARLGGLCPAMTLAALILRLDVEGIGDGAELAGLLLDGGGKFGGRAGIENLAGLDQARL